MPRKTIDVTLTKAQITQLAKDAAVCAAYCMVYAPKGNPIAAARRILKTLKLEA